MEDPQRYTKAFIKAMEAGGLLRLALNEICQFTEQLMKEIRTRPRTKKGFTHHGIDKKETTFIYYLN